MLQGILQGLLYALILLVIYILNYLQDPKLWELWYIPYYGQCRIYIINRSNRFLKSLILWGGVSTLNLRPYWLSLTSSCGSACTESLNPKP